MKWKCECHNEDSWGSEYFGFVRWGEIKDQQGKVTTGKLILSRFDNKERAEEFHGKLTPIEE